MNTRFAVGDAARQRFAATVAGLACAVALLFAPSASAATEAGSLCAANSPGGSTYSFFTASTEPGGLPPAAPVGGVITSWKTLVGIELPPGLISEALQVWRSTGAPNQYQLIAQSALSPVSTGLNVFPTRIPVQAGDQFGVTGLPVGLLCVTGKPGDAMSYVEKTTTPGGVLSEFETVPGYQIPAAVVIEPDVDGDGYGDETQDGCPQSAALQATCPVVTLDTISRVGADAVTVLLTTSATAPVKVSGTVKLGKAGQAKLSAKPKTAIAGKITSFKLKFSTKLKDALAGLEPNKKLTLKITAKATNVAGQVSTDKLQAKLKGRG